MMNDFYFLRPWLLLLFIPFIAGILAIIYSGTTKSLWHKICSENLIPYILVGEHKQSKTHYWLGIALGLLILALAGPSFGEKTLPLVKSSSGLVIALDLSAVMDANDVKPSRLKRAIYKINDLLDARKEGSTALIVFSESPYIVTPLTEDKATIKAMLPALDTTIMPKAGHSVIKAITKAIDLLAQGGVSTGHILLITSEIANNEVMDSIEMAKKNAITISVLGVGTDANTPIPKLDGGFLSDSKGAMILAKLTKESLQKVATLTSGSYVSITSDDSDIEELNRTLNAQPLTGSIETYSHIAYARHDQGYILILIALPLISLLFRRNIIFSLFILLPQGLQAYDWQSLWSTPDQQAEKHFHKGEYTEAKEKFSNTDWLGAANYKLGNYEAAADLYKQNNTLKGMYNYATTKAKSGNYEEALKAYDQVLESNPNHEDAIYNKKLIEEYLKQQDKKDQKPKSSEDKSKQKQDQNSATESKDDNQGKQQEKKANPDNNESEEKSSDEKSKNETVSEKNETKNEDSNPESNNKQTQDSKSQDTKEQELPSPDMKGKYSQEIDEKLEKESSQEAAEKAIQKEFDSSAEKEMRQMDERQLRRVADNPGELLRRKFLYQYKQQNR